jgi:hypothetical protein
MIAKALACEMINTKTNHLLLSADPTFRILKSKPSKMNAEALLSGNLSLVIIHDEHSPPE